MNDTSLETIAKRMEEMEGRLKYLEARDTPVIGDAWYNWRSLPSMYLSIPGLQGYWPGYIAQPVSSTYYFRDLVYGASMQFYPSSAYTNVQAHASVPRAWAQLTTLGYAALTTDVGYYKILGTEPYMASASRGLSMGMWVYFWSWSPTANASYFLLDKWQGSTSNRSYGLYITDVGGGTSTTFRFGVYDTSNTLHYVQSDNITNLVGRWWYVGGRYDPSASVDIFWGDAYTSGFNSASNTTSIPASLFDSTALLTIGARSDGTNTTDIAAGHWWIAGARINGNHFKKQWEQGRFTFG